MHCLDLLVHQTKSSSKSRKGLNSNGIQNLTGGLFKTIRAAVNEKRVNSKLGKLNFMDIIKNATLHSKSLSPQERAKLFSKGDSDSSESESN
jgi:hypothetical protein